MKLSLKLSLKLRKLQRYIYYYALAGDFVNFL